MPRTPAKPLPASTTQQAIPPHLSEEATRIANDRVALALLGLLSSGGLPKRSMRHSIDSAASALVPLARSMPALLGKTLRADARERAELKTSPEPRLSWADDVDEPGPTPDPADVDDDRLEDRISEGIQRRSPAFELFLRRMRRHLVQRVASAPAHPSDANVAILSRTLGLAPAEQAILRLAVAAGAGSMSSPFDFVDGQMTPRAMELLVREAAPGDADGLQRLRTGRSALMDARVIGSESSLRRWGDLDSALQLTALGQRLLLVPCADAAEMAARLLEPVALTPPDLPCDWPHLAAARATLLALLRGAIGERRAGVNLLLHGPSGTGKTLFATELLRELGVPAFQVGWSDKDEGPADRDDRLASLRLCQRFAPAGDAVLLLDEAEDIFTHSYPAGKHPLMALLGNPSEPKAWLNQLLENNPRPVIWISNRVDHMDPAYLRRFTLCVAFPTTPLTVRRVIAQQHLAPAGCSAALIDQAAAQPALSPALLASAATVARLVQGQGLAPDAAVQLALTQQLKVLGEPGFAPQRLCADFDLAHLNVAGSVSPQALMARLGGMRQGNLLFSGPPGTGKTELAHQIARHLGRELVVRTAADLHSKWYGESEQNVAAMFEGCDPQGEVLLIDEADALLGSRAADAHRADTAVVAEFLRRMETHAGILICATNHARGLDPALMRRFMFRLDFRPMSAAQRLQMLATLAGLDLEMAPLAVAQSARLNRLDQLTPGDFANVARRAAAMAQQLDVAEWLDELQAEHDVKPGASAQSIGFV